MMQSAVKPLALVTGVGPGTGAAVARRFAEGGYRVAMLARDAERLAALQAKIPDSIAVPCDVTDALPERYSTWPTSRAMHGPSSPRCGRSTNPGDLGCAR